MRKSKKTSRYRRKLFLHFFWIFLLFSISITTFQYIREKQSKRDSLSHYLDSYIHLFYGIYQQKATTSFFQKISKFQEIISLIPDQKMRLTLISLKGTILFDSSIKDYHKMTNHINRRELQDARKYKLGNDIRISTTNQEEYFYFARKFPELYIRLALPYDEKVISLLKANVLFLYFILIVFIVVLILMIYITDHHLKSINNLKRFTTQAAQGKFLTNFTFTNNELGDIGSEVFKIYKELRRTTIKLENERDKLTRHINISKEGVGLFDKDHTLLSKNQYFIDFIQLFSKESFDYDRIPILDIPKLYFFKEQLAKFQYQSDLKDKYLYKERVKVGEYVFECKLIIFKDKTYELMLNDITETVERQKIKQQMTSNIAHELKTPVSAINGFLETIINKPKLPRERLVFFLNRAFDQSNRLSELITDISTLNKIDEAEDFFHTQNINISDLVKSIETDYEFKFIEYEISFISSLPQDCTIKGNKFLLDAIFRNLIDNSVNYGGSKINIEISISYLDNDFLCFIYKDTGKGIAAEHLNRIFERFYRVDTGRQRKVGGTGLGLAIVRHAVEFHRGNIYVNSANYQGVEFKFSLHK